MGLVDVITESDVDSPETFARWVQQVTGSPWPDIKNMAILKKQIKVFFKNNPNFDYRVLCRTVTWANSKKRRYPHIWYYIAQVKWAYAAGALADFTGSEAREDALSVKIREALEVENREKWRYRLLGAAGPKARQMVYDEWVEDTQWAN